jgi:hypothetical protein
MTWSRKSLIAALLVVAPVITSCSERQDPMLPPTQVVAGPQDGLLDGLLGGVVGGVLNVVVGVLNILGGPDANGDVARAWIDNDGGTVAVAAYRLTVPRGAVSHNTLFEIKPANDGSYKVELSAYRNVNGNLVEVGHLGFNKPVLYTNSYRHARGVTDPRSLIIIYLRPDGKGEQQPSFVDLWNKKVTSTLSHFSKYALMQD